MKFNRLNKFILPPVPIGILTLIGLLLLSALLNYKAVKAQRYLEPTLALSRPRIEFAQNMIRLFEKEFGPKKIKGVVLSRNSIFVDNSLIFADPLRQKVINGIFLKKLSGIFLSMLSDPEMSSHFDLISVSTRLHVSHSLDDNKKRRVNRQYIAESIMDSMYKVEPDLLKYYGVFTATTVSIKNDQKDTWVEFRIIRNEHLHIEIMRSLNKYSF